MPIIRITAENASIAVQTFATATAEAIISACPIEARVNTWGQEVYFFIPVDVPREIGAKSVVDAGELAYWPDGKAIAIGFGPTPISHNFEIRLASPCNIWGRTLDDVTVFAPIGDGAKISAYIKN